MLLNDSLYLAENIKKLKNEFLVASKFEKLKNFQ